MDDSAPPATKDEAGAEPVLIETRVLTWAEILAQAVTIVYLLDVATHGEFGRDIGRRVEAWRAKHNAERRFRRQFRYTLYEAALYLSEQWVAHERH